MERVLRVNRCKLNRWARLHYISVYDAMNIKKAIPDYPETLKQMCPFVHPDDYPLMADTSYTPPQKSRGCLKPASCYRICADFSNTNKRFRPEGVVKDSLLTYQSTIHTYYIQTCMVNFQSTATVAMHISDLHREYQQ